MKSKIITVFLIVSVLCVGMQAHDQGISLNMKNVTVQKSILALQKQSGYAIVFAAEDLDVRQIVSVDANTLQSALSQILKGQDVTYDIEGNKIVIKKVIAESKPAGGRDASGVVVRGTVTDAMGAPVANAFVLEKGTLNGTLTDISGNYSFTVPAKATVSVECLGYVTVEFVAEADGEHNVMLKEDALFLDDVVVVGYSTTTRRDLISSVSQVKASRMSNLPTTNISQALAGRSPGLIVVQRGGGINVDPSISVRGGGEPLYVIDGVIRDKSDFVCLSPDDIEQMNILKDASATAIYGSRAANGIIQVVTKKGVKGKVAVDYDFNQSFSQSAFWPKTNPLWKQFEYANQAYKNEGLEPQYSEDVISKAKQGLDAQGRKTEKLRELTMRSWAPLRKHSLRVQGGSDVAQTYVSFTDTKQESLFKRADLSLSRTMFRIAETVNMKKFGVQINASVDGYRQSQHTPNSTRIRGSMYTLFSLLRNGPEYVVFNKYGLPWSNGNTNLYGELSKDVGYIHTTTSVVNAKGEIVWSVPWVKGLKLRASSDWRYYFFEDKNWMKDPAEYTWESTIALYPGQPALKLTNDKNVGYTNQAFVEYAGTFGRHTVSAVAGWEQYYEQSSDYWLQRTNYEFNVDQISIGPADKQTNGGSEAELGRAAFISQARYNFAGKYYAEGSFRYDGSDYFAPGRRWGAFVGGSIGWIVTAESWMKPLVEKNLLNMLKLRASYGQTGLDSNAGRFAYMQGYDLDAASYVVAGKFASGFKEGNLPSPDLTWYTTNQTDLGFDFGSAGNRLYGSFDYFFYKTFGYLMSPTGQTYLNTVMGIGMPKVKSDSEYRRAGVELQLGWRDSVGDFSYDIEANMTYFDQLWAYDQAEKESSFMNPYTRTQQNRAYYDARYHVLGFYADQADVFASVANLGSIETGYLAPGDLKYEDANGDGQITEADYRRLGKTTVPRCQFGINLNLGYKGFYFSTLIQGSSNFNKEMGGTNTMKTDQTGSLTTIYPYQQDTWTPSNTDPAYPRLMWNTNLNNNNNYLKSNFWLVDCAYIRIKDFQFGYDFKHVLLRKADWISKLRIGVSGQNLFTVSKSQVYGIDPEAGNASGYSYPVDRTVALTLNIGF